MGHATRTRLRTMAAFLMCMTLMALMFAAGRASALSQPYLEAALGHLEQARTALEAKDDGNKSAARTRAHDLTVQAIAAVREGLASGNK